MKDHLFAVIMAGGKGTRFWPLSRERMPKQLLQITSNLTMIQETVDRILPIIPHERIYVVTNTRYADEVHAQLPELPLRNILQEPTGRNTAAAIGFGAVHILKHDSDALMVVLPSDHLIKNVKLFRETLLTAVEAAQDSGKLLTIGITPTYPETGYGYIQLGNETAKVRKQGLYEVKNFREKPNAETAEEFIKSENFLWNSGMFAWRASTIQSAIERYLPRIYKHLMRIRVAIGTENERNVLNETYPELESISIDYGIMERAQQVFCIKGDFGWDDVGSWNALDSIWPADANQNAVFGLPLLAVNASHCVVYSPTKTVSLVNVSNLIIVETPDAVLICDRGRAQDVKKIVELLEQRGLKDLL